MIFPSNLHIFPVYVISCYFSTGSTAEAESTDKRESSKFLVLILLFSVILTALVFVALCVCYVYKREKYPNAQHHSSLDKETSYNSASNLISHNATLLPEFKVYISSPANPITGMIGISEFYNYCCLYVACHRLDNTINILLYLKHSHQSSYG